jgi:hypothetical protein
MTLYIFEVYESGEVKQTNSGVVALALKPVVSHQAY